MSTASFWKTLVWTSFAKPTCQRELYRHVRKARPRRIVEFGVGDLTRAERMIAIARRYQPHDLEYCGIDRYDARTGQKNLSIKDAHRRLSRCPAKVRLVPGDLLSAVARTANLLLDTDLLVIDSSYATHELGSVADLVPRMLHAKTRIARFEFESHDSAPRLIWLTPESFRVERSAAA